MSHNITGQLQVYVCHDGALEVYIDGRDIKEFLGIDATSMWVDFGFASISITRKPGEQTETRPKDFGKDTITRAAADERRKKPVEEKGGIGDLYFSGEATSYRDMIASVFGVPVTELEEKPPYAPMPGDSGFIDPPDPTELPF